MYGRCSVSVDCRANFNGDQYYNISICLAVCSSVLWLKLAYDKHCMILTNVKLCLQW